MSESEEKSKREKKDAEDVKKDFRTVRVHATEEAEEVKEILSAVSSEVPALIRNLLASVFSEEAGRSMGKAAAAFYKELKDSGMPNEVALEMTENYMGTFTNLGELMKRVGKRQIRIKSEDEDE